MVERSKSRYCPHCGAELIVDTYFCYSCGARLTIPQTEPSIPPSIEDSIVHLSRKEQERPLESTRLRGRRGEVVDLVEKLERGELTREEALELLEERGIKHHEGLKSLIAFLIWGVLCFSYVPLRITKSQLLEVFTQIPRITFPAGAIHLAASILVLTICMEVYISYFWRSQRGGLHSEGNPILLLTEGPYGIVRHPSHVNFTTLLIMITVVLSDYVPFTILSLIGNLYLVALIYWATFVEEREDCLRKWGDEYRQYMREVPRFNFILGIWRWIRRRSS